MTFAAPEDEAADPVAVSFFGADGEVEEAGDFAALVEEFGVGNEEIGGMSRAVEHGGVRLH